MGAFFAFFSFGWTLADTRVRRRIILKHLKRLIVSIEGGFQLIADHPFGGGEYPVSPIELAVGQSDSNDMPFIQRATSSGSGWTSSGHGLGGIVVSVMVGLLRVRGW